ncbi:MAG: DUF4197 domain-containing protein [Chitinophagaceae bacterium]|nr:DUF4197 domain-containing protein [Chitinophagaceae bacterium]MBN8666533.1 DUF4197 domain-containing protein [Chitinophagales bacterium]
MKSYQLKFPFAFLLAFSLLSSGCASSQSILDRAKKAAGIGGGGVTESEAGGGIKEALNQGVSTAVNFLNKKDGFFGNELYKVLLPPEAQKMEKTLRGLGLNKMVDDAILQINRGAEDAVGFATPIFVNAIKQMTVTDALKLVSSSSKSSITDYFKEKTSVQLKAAFQPVIDTSLQKTNATKYYGDVVTKYNSLPTTMKKMNPDLAGYVADKAIAALFDRIAVEEKNIRENPAARTTELLKKVFGK